jgi:flagellar hook-associated protein 3 FlgL
MRVTNQMIFDFATYSIDQASARSEQATEVASTGIRVQHPWDDPTAAGQIVTNQANASQFDVISTAVGRASDELQLADTSLSGVGNILTRASELAVQLSNSTYSAGDRAGAAAEIQQLFNQAVGDLNVQSGNRYLFGGNKDGTPPFDPSGNYNGDSAVRQVQVAPGVYEDASVRADVAIKGVGGGVDVLGTLSSFAAALGSNDVTQIQAAVGSLSQALTQVSTARSQLGSNMSVIESAQSVAQARSAAAQKQVSDLSNADVFDSTTKLAQAEQALNVTLTASAKSFQLTLLDKLP